MSYFSSTMEQLVFHISKLLESTDCVIVPGLGGFVSHEHSAELDLLKHRLNAPGKHLSFNPRLSKNDGLLANHLAETEGISYNEALIWINETVEQIKNRLKEKTTVHLGFLGSLRMEGDNVIFSKGPLVVPSKKHFGLESFHVVPVADLPVEKTRSNVIALEPKSNKKWWYAAAALPLALYLAWIPTSSGMLNPGYQFEASDLNPFKTADCTEYELRTSSWTPFDLEVDEPSIPSESNSRYLNLKLIESDKTLVVDLDPQEPIDERAISNTDQGYFTIVGCFSSRSNAEKLIAQLERKGLTASIIDFHKGLHRVATSQHLDQAGAREELARVKKIQPGAWLLKK